MIVATGAMIAGTGVRSSSHSSGGGGSGGGSDLGAVGLSCALALTRQA